MITKIIEYVSNNIEQIITMLISTIITISVVMQRTKLNRRVKDMQDLHNVELTIEEMELINKHRKDKGSNELLEVPKKELELKPMEKTYEELEEEEVVGHHDFIKQYLEIYKEVKYSLNLLKKYKNKYKYNNDIEKELEYE